MLLFANKARAALTGAVTSAAGQVAAVTTGAGALFVGVGGVATSTANPMRCVMTAVDASGNDTGAYEVVEVVRSGDTLTLQARGLEGTTAAAWGAGTIIECRPTASAADRSRYVSWGKGLRRYTDSARWIGIPGVFTYTTPGNTNASANSLRWHPFIVSTPLRVNAAELEVTTAATAGGVLRAGIYNADDEWLPTTLVADFGEVLTDTTGVKTWTPGTLLLPGRYFTVVRNKEAVSLRAIAGYAPMPMIPATMGSSHGLYEMVQLPGAYGALIADASVGTYRPQYFNSPAGQFQYHVLLDVEDYG